MHDYKFAWDYDEARADKKTMAIVADITKRLKLFLLPKIGYFNDFKIGYIKGIDAMGIYISGTTELPFIGVCLPVVKRTCREFKCPLEVGLETTILHEIGHAIQEYCGMPMDEEQAEDFAQNYWDYGMIDNFWKGE
jgi:hypothetical protein